MTAPATTAIIAPTTGIIVPIDTPAAPAAAPIPPKSRPVPLIAVPTRPKDPWKFESNERPSPVDCELPIKAPSRPPFGVFLPA